ncbi:chorismate lyase [Methanobrevibacter gottschalkii]|uniref:Chorismate lyase n=2 Tax=Methanobrevibacter gottschalkii TaxID=190974 RepID=A0A3N5C4B7_9EURY|nr:MULTISPECIES: chorismate pyruvate-lyase family protein [Methanobrevibacter]MCQ2970596.1 chorismate pyruvate-lyase family protein [archaeon]OEC95887.1 UbiC family transcriptional regulator [Methanobrevibacter sp. A27]RPF52975.1 chorismate lyase [Methanobrevibacter gottschalkii DSM 11977]SEK81005.1 chorismate lyase [Methanobrevibacter gottschalkii]
MSEPKNEANRGLIDKITQVEQEYGKNFSNTQKILLTTDGSITAILDVLYGKITLSTLDQHFEDADEYHAKLVNVNKGDEINYREVIMHRNGKPLIYAISHIPLSRCTKEVCADLIRADIPIGRILKNYNIESRREINNIYIEKPNETLKELFGTDEDMLARDYVIINHDKILMWIKEVFPISYFTEI